MHKQFWKYGLRGGGAWADKVRNVCKKNINILKKVNNTASLLISIWIFLSKGL